MDDSGTRESEEATASLFGERAVSSLFRGRATRVSGLFGEDRGSHAHGGVDIAAPFGTPVYAPVDGVVTYAGQMGSYGNVVRVEAADGKSFLAAHLDGIKVRQGEAVKMGQQFGTVGSTGRSTGPHLHYEVIGEDGETKLNPLIGGATSQGNAIDGGPTGSSLGAPAPRGAASAGGTGAVPGPLVDAVATYYRSLSRGVGADVFDNPLDGYVNVIPMVEVAMVKAPASGSDFDQLERLYASDGGSVTLASTGSLFDDADSYFGFQELRMTTVPTISAANPEFSNTVEMALTLAEPHGFSFDRTMREVAAQLGYSVSSARTVWRVSTSFSGYDQTTGAWTQRIPFKYPGSSGVDRAVHYCHPIAVESKPSAPGSTHSVTLVPYSFAAATRPELTVQEGLSVEWGDSKGGGKHFGAFVDRLQAELNARFKEKELYHTVVFDAHPAIKDALWQTIPAEQQEPADLTNPFVMSTEEGTFKISVSRDMPLYTVVYQLLQNMGDVHYLGSPEARGGAHKNVPGVNFAIVPSVSYAGASPDPKTNDLKGITFKYTVEPFFNWRVRFPADQDRDSLTNGLLASSALRRVYSYLWTGENTEVISWDITLKNYYYVNTGSKAVPSMVPDSIARSSSDNSQQRAQNSGGGYNPFAGSGPEVTLRVAFGDAQRRDPLAGGSGIPNEQRPAANGAGANVEHLRRISTSMPSGIGDVSGGFDPSSPKANLAEMRRQYAIDFEKLIGPDLVQMESMEVRGDPRWLLGSQQPPTSSDRVLSQVIYVDAKNPDQSQYMDPNWSGPRDGDLSFSGFYSLVKIEHTVTGTKFTQRLSGYRMLDASTEPMKQLLGSTA